MPDETGAGGGFLRLPGVHAIAGMLGRRRWHDERHHQQQQEISTAGGGGVHRVRIERWTQNYPSIFIEEALEEEVQGDEEAEDNRETLRPHRAQEEAQGRSEASQEERERGPTIWPFGAHEGAQDGGERAVTHSLRPFAAVSVLEEASPRAEEAQLWVCERAQDEDVDDGSWPAVAPSAGRAADFRCLVSGTGSGQRTFAV